VPKCSAVCCIFLTYAKLKEMQSSKTNFVNVQKVEIIKVIKCLIPPLLWHHCVIGLTIWLLFKKNNKLFNILSNNCS